VYCLTDNLKAKYNQPYFPEKEPDEQGISNAIRLKIRDQTEPVEISQLLPRMRPLTKETVDRVRYYIPKDLESAAAKLRSEWKKAR
jgi:hypothetical protein